MKIVAATIEVMVRMALYATVLLATVRVFVQERRTAKAVDRHRTQKTS